MKFGLGNIISPEKTNKKKLPLGEMIEFDDI